MMNEVHFGDAEANHSTGFQFVEGSGSLISEPEYDAGGRAAEYHALGRQPRG